MTDQILRIVTAGDTDIDLDHLRTAILLFTDAGTVAIVDVTKAMEKLRVEAEIERKARKCEPTEDETE